MEWAKVQKRKKEWKKKKKKRKWMDGQVRTPAKPKLNCGKKESGVFHFYYF